MKNRIEVIDYLRAISILAIILLHLILPTMYNPQTIYSSNNVLFVLWTFLNLLVISLIICSGFSLYVSHPKLKIRKKDLTEFYGERLKRILIPFIVFSLISLVMYIFLKIFFMDILKVMTNNNAPFQILNFFMIPIGWIFLKWIIGLILLLTILFPFLKWIYHKKIKALIIILLLYIINYIIYIQNPIHANEFLNRSFSLFQGFFSGIIFILGWSLVYFVGFYLADHYSKKTSRKTKVYLSLTSIFIFIAVFLVYRGFGLSMNLSQNKYPLSPYFLSLGLTLTVIILNVLSVVKKSFPRFIKKTLDFFSYNSFWIYLWSLLVFVFVAYFFLQLSLNVYLKLSLEFLSVCILVSIFVFLQKWIIKKGIWFEDHYF